MTRLEQLKIQWAKRARRELRRCLKRDEDTKTRLYAKIKFYSELMSWNMNNHRKFNKYFNRWCDYHYALLAYIDIEVAYLERKVGHAETGDVQR